MHDASSKLLDIRCEKLNSSGLWNSRRNTTRRQTRTSAARSGVTHMHARHDDRENYISLSLSKGTTQPSKTIHTRKARPRTDVRAFTSCN